MNIEQEALYKLLQGADIKSQYFFNTDFKTIAEKAEIYRKKNGKMPSVNFLLEFSNKLSDNPEQVDSIEDLLYTQSKFKPELDDAGEVNELLLEFYKKEKIKEFTLGLGKALKEGNDGKVQRLSEQITEVSKLSLSEEFSHDIKQDLDSTELNVEIVPTGFGNENTHISLSKIARGSLILLLGGTGSGKSVLAIQATTNNYLDGYSVCYLSYELDKGQVMSRVLSQISEVPISEIISKNYTTEEAEIRIQAAKIVLKKKIDFEKAFNRILKKKNFDDIEDRTNIFKIIAIQSSGHTSEELPTNVGILNLIETNKTIDYFTIDLATEIPFENSLGSYERDLAIFGKALKSKALMQGCVVTLLSQPSGDTPRAMIYPRDCKALKHTCDSAIVISATSEMKIDKYSCLIVSKARINRSGLAIPFQNNFQIMRFEALEEAPIEEEAYWKEYGKEIKKGEK